MHFLQQHNYTISYLTYPVLVLAGKFTLSNTQGHLSTRERQNSPVCALVHLRNHTFWQKLKLQLIEVGTTLLPTVPNLVSGFYCLYCYNFGHSPHKPQQKDTCTRTPTYTLGRWLINPKLSPHKTLPFCVQNTDVQMMEKKTLC